MHAAPVSEHVETGARPIRLRYRAVCAICDLELSPGSQALWDRAAKTATCLACAPSEGDTRPEAGKAGTSAATEGQRRKQKRVEDARRRYGDHAAAVAEAMAERDTAASWTKGSEGESRLAAFISREVGEAVIPLHDRLIPGTRGNIDHIFVAPTGVWVVDAKAYKGKVVQREIGPIWRRDNEVIVGGRNQTKLATGVEKQVDAVLAALRGDPSVKGAPVWAVLCFLDSEWGLFDLPFQIRSVWVMYPGALRKRLKKKGSLSRDAMEHIARRLDLSLPPASAASRRPVGKRPTGT
jgi:hypothetical protein